MTRILVVLGVLALGVALGTFVPEVPATVRRLVAASGVAELTAPKAQERNGHGQGHAHGHGHGSGEKHEGPEGVIKLTPERVAAAKIEVSPVEPGTLTQRLTVPGTVTPDPDRVARVAAKVIGTVAELRKRLGDTVEKGEVVAVLESREVAEAKSDYLGAIVNFDLQKTLFEREQSLFQKGISAEQQFLRARNAFTEAQLRVNLARQKLSALDLSDQEVADLPKQPISTLRQKGLRAPLAGRIVERRVDLGAPVGGEGQEKELYVIADLSVVWIELAVSTTDLQTIKEGQRVSIGTGDAAEEGRIVFISPILNQETRSARVVASIDNKGLAWRPGSFVTARVLVEEQPVDLRVPRTALQTINGEQVVFVRTADGFEKREVVPGKSDDDSVELVFGLDAGERVAITNTFVLKAELGKAEAEHVH